LFGKQRSCCGCRRDRLEKQLAAQLHGQHTHTPPLTWPSTCGQTRPGSRAAHARLQTREESRGRGEERISKQGRQLSRFAAHCGTRLSPLHAGCCCLCT
jgi:hypothetical protein